MPQRRTGRCILTRTEIITLAREVVANCGGQTAVASALDVTQSSISKALREGDVRMDRLRKRILEEMGGYQVGEDSYFEVIMPRRRRP